MNKLKSLDLCQTKWETVPYDAAIGGFGSRRTGKTTNELALLNKMLEQVERVVIMCGNDDNIAEYSVLVPALYVGLVNLDRLRKIVEDQKAIYTEAKDDWLEEDPTRQPKDFVCPRDKRLLVVLEDTGYDDTILSSKIVNELISNARHFGTGIHILCQYITQLPRKKRSNLDLIYMTATADTSMLDNIYKMFVGELLLSRKAFYKLVAKCTDRRGEIFVLNNICEHRNDPNERFSYRYNRLPLKFNKNLLLEAKTYHRRHFLSRRARRRIQEHHAEILEDATAREEVSEDEVSDRQDSDASSVHSDVDLETRLKNAPRNIIGEVHNMGNVSVLKNPF
jgi:hypothetical protein